MRDVCILSTMQVWSPLAGRRQNQSVWCTTTTPSTAQKSRTRCEGVLRQRRYGRWLVAVFYNILNLPGINARILFKECTSSRRARRKSLQQLAEELRAEYMEEKGASAVATRWAAEEAAEATTAAAAGTEMETVPVRTSCKWDQTSDTWNATSPCVVTT